MVQEGGFAALPGEDPVGQRSTLRTESVGNCRRKPVEMRRETILFSEVKSAVFGPHDYITESLILAQNERWRRVLSMQVERQASFGVPRAANG